MQFILTCLETCNIASHCKHKAQWLPKAPDLPSFTFRSDLILGLLCLEPAAASLTTE